MISRRLKVFLKVAETGSFSKAADELFITPSAVVQQMNSLEEDLKCRLMNRTNRGITLTAAGELVAEKGRGLLRQNEELIRELEMLSTPGSTIKLGTHLLYNSRCLKQEWPEFHKQYPNYNLEIIYRSFFEQDMDCFELIEGVKFQFKLDDGWHFLELGGVPLAVLVTRNHPLAGKERLRLEELLPYKLVSVGQDNKMSEVINRFNADAEKAGITVEKVPYYAPDIFDRCEFEQLMLQIPACWDMLAPEMVMIPIIGDYMLPYGFMYSDELSAAAKAFLDYIRKKKPRPDFLAGETGSRQ